MKQINDKVIDAEEWAADHIQNSTYTSVFNELVTAFKAGQKAAPSLLSDEECYVEVKTEDELPNKKGPYFVKVKNPEGSAMVFKDYDIYMWLDGPEFPQVEMWKNTFSVWLRKVKVSELLNK